MSEDKKISAAARWLIDRRGDGPSLIGDALCDLGVIGVIIPCLDPTRGVYVDVVPPMSEVFDLNLDPSSMIIERRYLGECERIGGIGSGEFWASRRAYEDGVARYGSKPPLPLHGEMIRFMARRTVELWREDLSKKEEPKQ